MASSLRVSNSARVIASRSSRLLAEEIWSAGLVGAPAGSGLDGLSLGPLDSSRPFQLTVPDTLPASDQVHQDSHPRDEDHEQHPERPGDCAEVVAAEDVAHDPEQAHEPGEQEELEQGYQERSFGVEPRSACQ